MSANHSMQRMRASRLHQLQFGRLRRLARTADAGRGETIEEAKQSLGEAIRLSVWTNSDGTVKWDYRRCFPPQNICALPTSERFQP